MFEVMMSDNQGNTELAFTSNNKSDVVAFISSQDMPCAIWEGDILLFDYTPSFEELEAWEASI